MQTRKTIDSIDSKKNDSINILRRIVLVVVRETIRSSYTIQSISNSRAAFADVTLIQSKHRPARSRFYGNVSHIVKLH